MRAGATYANVHTVPSFRAARSARQIEAGGSDDDDD